MPSSDLIEVVAEALWAGVWSSAGFSHPEGFSGRPDGIRQGYYRKARVAIVATIEALADEVEPLMRRKEYAAYMDR